MLQKLPVNDFEWMEETSEFNEDIIKIYNEESDEGYFLEVDVRYPQKYMIFIMTYHFYLKERNWKKPKSL